MFYISISILIFILIVVSFYCVKFAIIIINMQEVIEESLDVIDEKYKNLSKIL